MKYVIINGIDDKSFYQLIDKIIDDIDKGKKTVIFGSSDKFEITLFEEPNLTYTGPQALSIIIKEEMKKRNVTNVGNVL